MILWVDSTCNHMFSCKIRRGGEDRENEYDASMGTEISFV
jgi:hypothetical protein